MNKEVEERFDSMINEQKENIVKYSKKRLKELLPIIDYLEEELKSKYEIKHQLIQIIKENENEKSKEN